MKCPPPPSVGDIFDGPRIKDTQLVGKYHVRAVVDNEGEDPNWGWIYQVVFRYRVGDRWCYEIVSSHTIAVGLYKPRKRKED